MKRILNKFRKTKEAPPSSRITSDTVAHHRERILAGGRRFKYPIQYARHKLVINAIAISIVTLVVALGVGWWQLYKVQNTSEFFYRVTRIIPVPVASVDGEGVLYSDYLMKYRSSVHYLESKEQLSQKTDDGKRQVEYIKEQSMQDVIADAYAQKLAREINISVDQSEVESFLLQQRQSSDGEISEQTYETVIMDFYGWSPDEYRHTIERKLLRQKVAYSVDDEAKAKSDSIVETIKNNSKIDFNRLAVSYADLGDKAVTYGSSGWVPANNQDGGLAMEAAKLKIGQNSSPIKSTLGDGYYILRLLDSKTSQVSYEYVKIELTVFAKKLDIAKSENKISEFITIVKN